MTKSLAVLKAIPGVLWTVLIALGGFGLLLLGARRRGEQIGAAKAEAREAEAESTAALHETEQAVAAVEAAREANDPVDVSEAEMVARDAAKRQRERLLRRVRGGALILGMLLAPTRGWAKPPAPDPVADCPIGLVCFRPEEVNAVEVRIIHLERDLRLAQARTRRFGLTTGCGPGTAVELDGGELTLEPKIFCGLVWGMRW